MVSLGQVIALIKAMGGSGGGSSLPSDPSTDGAYVLENDVASGSAAVKWGEKGWSAVEGKQTVISQQDVTTALVHGQVRGDIDCDSDINADYVIVTFNGVEYLCHKKLSAGYVYYGSVAEDFVEYPFLIQATENQFLFTETAGTYSLKVEAVEIAASTTPTFEAAVAQANAKAFLPMVFIVRPGETTFTEIMNACDAGNYFVVQEPGGGSIWYYPVTQVDGFACVLNCVAEENGTLVVYQYASPDGDPDNPIEWVEPNG